MNALARPVPRLSSLLQLAGKKEMPDDMTSQNARSDWKVQQGFYKAME
jgi:hypothetical protein